MPVHYRVEEGVVTIHPFGTYSSNDLRDAWRAAEADPAYPEDGAELRICVDARDAKPLATKSVADLRDTVEWFAARALRSSRHCAFVTRPGLQFGLARMMAAWIEYRGYSAFVATDMQEALRWLRNPDRAASLGG